MNDNHLTPKWLIEALEKEFGKFDLDPCANKYKKNQFAKTNFVYPRINGLTSNWFGKVFVNPPYSQGNIPKWIEKAINYNAETLNLVVMLLPSDTSTRWYHNTFCIRYELDKQHYYYKTDTDYEIRLLDRINFSNSKNNAKFPSMLVII